jgi:hypothetical protein
MVAEITLPAFRWLGAIVAGVVAGVILPIPAGTAAVIVGLLTATATGGGDPNGQLGGFLIGWLLGLFVIHTVSCALVSQLLASRLGVPAVVPWISTYLPLVVAADALLFAGWS